MKKFLFGITLFLILAAPGFSIPTPPEFEELVKNSDFIAKSKLTNVRQNKLGKNTISVGAEVEILKLYKSKGSIPNKLNIAFIIFPEYFGKWLREAPPEGEYIIFYIKKKVKDSSGKEGEIITLFEPHPFAFKEYSEETEKRILNLSK
ncbi:MAG: hypothetical protein L6Q54_06105 [Leptospiraceae bacterium]|nr:hypothetical protein [Leptospiraceae bacterium]MCK6380809.1 hypothetical protein [Leptospiraceae bacterium]NUM41688.1 hypothetical protein [Leptospiraceae bacterium]